MRDLQGLNYAEFEPALAELGIPAVRALSVWQWLWQKGVTDFDQMTGISAKTSAILAEHFCISLPAIQTQQVSRDGTRKLLLKYADGATVETVLIPGEARHGIVRLTQCLSCQVGCAMGCAFCATGQMGFTRNLSTAEILGQVLVARKVLHDHDPARPLIRNVVFMGMGEPLLNIDNVLRALEIIHDPRGANFSPRRMGVSTCGLPNGLKRLGDSGLAFINISLHAPTQQLRAQLMPKAAKWPLEDLITALKAYPLKAKERLTLEYLLLGGVNDTAEHARALGLLVKEIGGKLNLISFNPVPQLPYKAPAPANIRLFITELKQMGITAIMRKSKGADIAAACGQLKTETQARNA